MSRKKPAPATPQTAGKPGLPSARQLARVRAALWRAVCSAPWFDACLAAAVAGKVPLSRHIGRDLDRAGHFPPGGSARNPADPRSRTLMRRCVACGVWCPPQYVRRDSRCEDCHAVSELPPDLSNTDAHTHRPSTCSPSAMAIRAAGHYGVRLVEQRLAAEDVPTLRKQAARYLQTQPKRKEVAIDLGRGSK